MPDPTTVLLVDDHPFIREGIRSFLADFPEFKVVGEAATGEEALDKIKAAPPDMVLMDLNLPAEAIATLEHRTEGWVTGLQLAALSLRFLGLEEVVVVKWSFCW